MDGEGAVVRYALTVAESNVRFVMNTERTMTPLEGDGVRSKNTNKESAPWTSPTMGPKVQFPCVTCLIRTPNVSRKKETR